MKIKKVWTIQVWSFMDWVTDSVLTNRKDAVKRMTELRQTLRVKCLEENL